MAEPTRLLGIKHGVRPRSLWITVAAVAVARELGIEAIITSGEDGTHRTNSRHYSGEALDFRIRHLTASQIQAFMAGLRRALGGDYQVIQEPTHVHVEYDPPKAGVPA